MIRTHIIPDSNNMVIAIPDSYIGKKVEVIVFADDDLQQTPIDGGKTSKYKGMLSKERALELQKFAEQIRKEWDRDI